jgi:hypothetical protein
VKLENVLQLSVARENQIPYELHCTPTSTSLSAQTAPKIGRRTDYQMTTGSSSRSK